MSTREAVRHRSWPVPAALLGLSAIPLTAGTLQPVSFAVAVWADLRPARRRTTLATRLRHAGALS